MSIKATRRTMISCYAQIINDYVLGYKIPELVKHEKIKARMLSYASQMYLLMLGQFLHVFSLNELVDISKIYAKELSRIRGNWEQEQISKSATTTNKSNFFSSSHQLFQNPHRRNCQSPQNSFSWNNRLRRENQHTPYANRSVSEIHDNHPLTVQGAIQRSERRT